jgi:hypothetical protein
MKKGVPNKSTIDPLGLGSWRQSRLHNGPGLMDRKTPKVILPSTMRPGIAGRICAMVMQDAVQAETQFSLEYAASQFSGGSVVRLPVS